MKAQHTTLKDIARQLGVTVATVSRALKNYPDISPATKKAVLDLAAQLKYRPNPIALNLRASRSNIIGVVIPEIVHHFFSTVISGIMDVADQAGYSVMICQTNETYRREVRETGTLLNSRVDGLLISLSNETELYGHLQEFVDHGVPLVLFDKVCDELDVTKVIVDDYAGAFGIVEHLIRQGSGKIALMRGPTAASNSRLRLAGYVDALKKHALPIREEYILECTGGVTYETGIRLTRQLMQLPDPPDAIFAVADPVSIGAISVLKQMGFGIPYDVAVAGFSDWEMASVVEPALTSVYQPGFEMGQVAAKLLLEQIERVQDGRETTAFTRVLPTKLMVRQSSLRKIV